MTRLPRARLPVMRPSVARLSVTRPSVRRPLGTPPPVTRPPATRPPVTGGRERGAATVEFVFAGALLLVPLLYLVLALSEVQRNTFAVTQAARESGRAYATADDPATAPARAAYAVRLALADQNLAGTAELRWGPVGRSCEGLTVDSTVIPVPGESTPGGPVPGGAVRGAPPLAPGALFEFCVRRTYRFPGVPTVLDAGRNTVEARYVVRVDDLRSVP